MTDLTDRMRTCAAHLLARKEAGDPWAVEMIATDAAALLLEASDIIEAAKLGTVLVDDQTAEALGLPMEVIPPIVTQNAPPIVKELAVGQWVASGDALVSNPYRSKHTCPKCDSRAGKTVRVRNAKIWLECPSCEHVWKAA